MPIVPADVKDFVARRFPVADRPAALELLAQATIHDDSAAEPRLLRCAAVASGGSLRMLRYYVDLLKVDYRDVIMAGEYLPAAEPIRVRDLYGPIAEDDGAPD